MRRQIFVPALVAGLLGLAACAGPQGSGGPGAGDSLAGTEWRLVGLGGGPVAADAWIGFEADGEAGGNAGCNHFGGSYEQDGARLVLGDIFATAMACTAPGRMETEAQFLSALRATTQASVTGDLLELSDAEGRLLATLARRSGA